MSRHETQAAAESAQDPAAEHQEQASSHLDEAAGENHQDAESQHASGDSHPAADAHSQDAHATDGHDEHHDPYDLSELNATPGSTLRQVSVMGLVAEEGGDPLEDPAEWRFDMSMFTMLVFLVLFGALAKFAWKPIVSGLDARESSIAAMIDEAKNSHEQAAQRLQEYEAKLAAAAQEAQNIVNRAKQDAQVSAERILADAEAAAVRQRERAIAEIESAKTAALTEIAEKSVDAALGLAGNIVRQKLHREEHADLIRDALERFPSKT